MANDVRAVDGVEVGVVKHNVAGDSAGRAGQPRRPRRATRAVSAKCPLRYGEPCTLCQPGANGPEDCQTVAMVMGDPELRDMWREMNLSHRGRKR